MSLFAKIMVVVNFFLAVAFLAAAGTLLGAAEDWKNKYEKSSETATQTITAQKAQIEAADKQIRDKEAKSSELSRLLATQEATHKQLEDSNKQLEQANIETRRSLETLTGAQKDLQGKNSEKDARISALTDQLSRSESERKDAETKNRGLSEQIAQLSQDKDTAEKGLASQQAANSDLSAKNDELATTVQRYRAEKGQLTGAIAMKAVNGVVQAASNKDDIYVLSVGAKDNVEVGYEFTIYRDNQYVTTIVIEKVYPNMSSGRSKPGTKKREVQAGDQASTQL